MTDWDDSALADALDHTVLDHAALDDDARDDAVLARGMYAGDGGLTAAGWQRLERWSQEYDAEVRTIARRWGRVVLTIDVVGLPVLLLLTSWPWAVVGWLVVVVALVAVGATVCHRARETRARTFVARQLRLRSLAGLTPPATANEPVTEPAAQPTELTELTRPTHTAPAVVRTRSGRPRLAS